MEPSIVGFDLAGGDKRAGGIGRGCRSEIEQRKASDGESTGGDAKRRRAATDLGARASCPSCERCLQHTEATPLFLCWLAEPMLS